MPSTHDVAHLFLVGFDGHTVSPGVRALIDLGVAGVILFGRNVESPRQVAELCGEIKRLAGRPILICIDQEGGRVRRLREGFTAVPSMRAVGATGDERLAHEIGAVLGRELRAVNIDVDLAPSVDVDTNPANPVIGDRSFGASPELVARMGAAVIRGIQDQGVAACAKHFPGHGDTAQDSHAELPRLPHAIERLRAVELPPFRAAVEAGVAMVMTSHVVFEPVDPLLPATLSAAVIGGVLRREMGFDGVVVSDDLEMEAIAANFSVDEVVTRGAGAGVDLLAVCHDEELQHRAIEALGAAVRLGAVSEERVAHANRRVGRLMDRYARGARAFDATVLGCEEHRAVVARVGKAVDGTDPTRR
ncbi:MAG TPA: beta-N-acetylhexosaminidase [Tepidisphaeraceae bacterium]|nr:beta-N-acetylhexosaminidase [Tepidisphaeraceae bacterium]